MPAQFTLFGRFRELPLGLQPLLLWLSVIVAAALLGFLHCAEAIDKMVNKPSRKSKQIFFTIHIIKSNKNFKNQLQINNWTQLA
jgi:hypothetical protein